jgi:hypothetical protein
MRKTACRLAAFVALRTAIVAPFVFPLGEALFSHRASA